MGKHTTRTPEIVQAVLDGMAEEGLSLRESCAKAGVANSTFMTWVAADPDLSEQYARALQEGVELTRDNGVKVVSAPPEMLVTPFGPRVDPGYVAWQKLQLDVLKWDLAKRAPKKYGDKLEISGDKESPLAVALDVSKMSTGALAEIMAAQDAAKPS